MENLTNGDTCLAKSALAAPPAEIAAALAVLGGKWKILILWQLLIRVCRFNELRKAAPGISQHMLTLHVREFVDEGLVTRTIFAEVPPRVEYALTDHGISLGIIMKTLAEWGQLYQNRLGSRTRR